ncbi:MAG TPA: hypothetical protein VHB21_03735, partial [Minicystis sp.]|nr:hypothetical protein [Minicystis sp.]
MKGGGFMVRLLCAAACAAALGCEEQPYMQPRVTPDPPAPPGVGAPGLVASTAPAPNPSGLGPTLDLPEWHKNDKNPENHVGQYAWSNVDPRFVTAVANFGSEYRKLVAAPIEVTAVARCLASLGDALEAVPQPGAVDVKGAGERIKAEAARAAGAP